MDPDAQIRAEVLEELDLDPDIDPAAIVLTVDDGVVTLAGHVPTYWQRCLAEGAVKRVKGVRALIQQLEVRLERANAVTDEEIARRAADLIGWSVAPPDNDVGVRVENGWVTLHGEVAWAAQRDSVEQAVRRLAGVRGVVNDLTARADDRVRDISIKRALERHAQIRAAAVTVAVADHRVILSGKVRSWRERSALEQAAWATAGVKQVVDNLVIG